MVDRIKIDDDFGDDDDDKVEYVKLVEHLIDIAKPNSNDMIL